MKISIREIFCEILSGFVMIMVLAAFICIKCELDQSKILTWIVSFTESHLVLLIFFSYLVGLVVDAVGFAFGETGFDLLVFRRCKMDPPAQQSSLWAQISEHVLAYRDRQWAYYSCYRNLFLLFIPGTVAWSILIFNLCGWLTMSVFIFMMLATEVSLWFSMIGLLRIYIRIGKEFESQNNPAKD
ncbi:hypothetical protein [Marinoscillum pacificum]|uniref:hypothetical protein n=1 Tax=Marinoscillum pacificum TaxID=392723 RepID=UPI002157C847|nr:hypothetical protein [Marinoscillum pacificum]